MFEGKTSREGNVRDAKYLPRPPNKESSFFQCPLQLTAHCKVIVVYSTEKKNAR